MKSRIVVSMVVCLALAGSVSAYNGSRDFTNTFSEPFMTNWDEYAPGAYNGGGQYVLTDAEGILRYIDEGSFTATIDIVDIDLATGDPSAGDAGYLSLLLYDTGYRLHASMVNANDGNGDRLDFLGDRGSGYEYWASTPQTEIDSLSLKYEFNAIANTISVWAAINGGEMVNYIDNQISHDLGNGPMLEQIYAAEHYASGNNTPGSPTFSLDHYNIVPEPATMLMLGLGGLLIRRKR